MFIIIDGPEKAGKTTLATAICQAAAEEGLSSKYQHFSGKNPVTADSFFEVMDDIDTVQIVVWDRSWASGQVYHDLGFSQSEDALQANGEELFAGLQPMKVMLLGPSAAELQGKRTPDDLPVPAAVERSAFQEYARKYNWPVVRNAHTDEALIQLVHAFGIV